MMKRNPTMKISWFAALTLFGCASPVFAQGLDTARPARNMPAIQSSHLEMATFELEYTDTKAMEAAVSKLFPEIVSSTSLGPGKFYVRASAEVLGAVEIFIQQAEQEAKGKELLRSQEENGAQKRVLLFHDFISPETAIATLANSQLKDQVKFEADGDYLVLTSFSQEAINRVVEFLSQLEPDKASQIEGRVNLGRTSTVNNSQASERSQDQASITTAQVAASGAGGKRGLAEFRAQQQRLREQIELQRQKLAMLEKRLEQRARQAEAHFSLNSNGQNQPTQTEALDSEMSNAPAESISTRSISGDAEISYDPEIGTIVVRGERESVEKTTGVIKEIMRAQDAAPVDRIRQNPKEQQPAVENTGAREGHSLILPLPVEAEREAAEEIREAGGWYKLNDQDQIEEINMVYFEDSHGKRHENSQRSDSFLGSVADLEALKKLYLQGGQVRDRSMVCVAQCENLEKLYVWDASELSDDGIVHLAELPKLRNIHIDNGQLTDKSLKVLSQLPEIDRLVLQDNNFTDKGLEYLSQAPGLTEVWVGLGNSRFTNEGLRQMLALKKLKKFGFQHSPINQETADMFQEAGVELVSPTMSK